MRLVRCPVESCRRCERMVREPAPAVDSRAAWQADTLLSSYFSREFDDHLSTISTSPRIFSPAWAQGLRGTPCGLVRRAMKALSPLIETDRGDSWAADLLACGDTPDPGAGPSALREGR